MDRLPANHHADLDRLPEYYWWHRHRIEMVLSLIPRFFKKPSEEIIRYLDVGGGTGATTVAVASGLRDQAGFSLDLQSTLCLEGDTTLSPQQMSTTLRS